MRLLAHVHMYPPAHNAGAELMLHTILRWLAGRGHECRVALREAGVPGTLDGVEVYPRCDPQRVPELYAWADAAVTHLDLTRSAVRMARLSGTPLVHLVHNHNQLYANGVTRSDSQLAVFNSRWLSRRVPGVEPRMVLHPPVFADEYRVPRTADSVRATMVNLSPLKGAPTFYQTAARVPEVAFLGVLGAYDPQVPPPPLPNLTVVANTPDMRRVYEHTRVLLVPSRYESWGRCGVEAMASGIPVVAAPTPGLRESLGRAAILVDQDRPDLWAEAVRCLYADEEAYECHSRLSLARSAELDPTAQLEEFEAAVLRFG